MSVPHPKILKLLGGSAVLGARGSRKRPHRGGAARHQAEQGLEGKPASIGIDPEPYAYAAAEALAERLGEPVDTIRRLLRLSDRTWDRRRFEDQQFSEDESDRLYRIARVLQRAIDVFGDEGKARGWLTRENRTMALQRPLDLLGTDQGASVVADELSRIDYGDLF
jgi:putative toxin-antitoxin system antitoxin component (TIGR02293 family)